MAVEFFTGFEGCGQRSDVQAFFDSVYSSLYPTYSATQGHGSGKCLTPGATVGIFTKNTTAAKAKTLGLHINNCGVNNYSVYLWECLCRFVGPDITIWNTTAGFDIRRGTTQIATSTAKIGAAITHVEIKVFSNVTTGTVQIKINGVLVVNESSLNTGGADITSVYFGTCNNASQYYDNIFIADDWQGELKSSLLQPTSDTAVEFTRSAGAANYALVDDAAQDGDTTYVESNTLNHEDFYGYSDIATTAVIKAISLVTVAKRTDATARSMQHVARQGATDYDLDTFVLATAYPAAAGAGQFEVLDVAPDASAWTPTILNAMSFGFKVAA